jgi:hypothetical protein
VRDDPLLLVLKSNQFLRDKPPRLDAFQVTLLRELATIE